MVKPDLDLWTGLASDGSPSIMYDCGGQHGDQSRVGDLGTWSCRGV